MPDDELKDLVSHIVSLLEGLSDDEVVEVIGGLSEVFCLYCGWKTNGAICHCTNDE